jgi:hypothetical protein
VGISLKLQEEERERRENYIPPVSFLEELQQNIEIDHVLYCIHFISFMILFFFRFHFHNFRDS